MESPNLVKSPFNPTEEREVMRRKVKVEAKGYDEAKVSILRGGEPYEAQTLTFEQLRQFMHDIQNVLLLMSSRRV